MISDENTTLTIGGTWNNYFLFGTNSSIGTGSRNPAIAGGLTSTPTAAQQKSAVAGFGVLYSVATGRMVTVGD